MSLVVSMTTIPSRIGRIRPMVDSIRRQTREPDVFLLWLPLSCEKEGKGYRVPGWMASGTMPAVMPTERDWGPATKLIPLMSMSWAPDTLFVTVDDDVVYDPHTLEELEKASGRFPDTAVGLVGVRDKKYVHGEELKTWSMEGIEVDVIGGYRGVAYPWGLLDDSLRLDAEELMRDGPFVIDDHLVSHNLKRRGKKLVVARTMYGTPEVLNFRALGLGNGIYDEGENRRRVNQSMGKLREYYRSNGWAVPK